MISFQCDGCYKTIKTLPTGAIPASVTVFLMSVNQKPVCNFHLCTDCVTKKQTFYIDNPLFVPPSEDAESEKKAAQGS